MNNTSGKRSLFEEKSLNDLLRVYESAFPHPLTSKLIGGWLGILVFLILLFSWYIKGLDAASLQKSTSLIASFALTVSSALMGVVIAGMSIFAASLKPKVANGLIETPYPGTNISSLKFIFAMFAYVLSSLFLTISISGIYYIFLADGALVIGLISVIRDHADTSGVLKFTLVTYVSILLGTAVFLGSLLKSFIWNLHQVLLVVVVFNEHTDDQ